MNGKKWIKNENIIQKNKYEEQKKEIMEQTETK